MDNKLIFSKVVKIDKDKPWLVMVHGFTANYKIFDRQIAFFRKRFNILLIDLRGHGDSLHIKGPYGREEYTDDLELIVESYGLDRFYYWSTHTGSAIGLIYYLRHPKHVLGLVLEGTPLPGFSMPRLTELIERAEKISREKSIEEAKIDWFNNADWFEYMRTYPEKCRAKEHWQIINEFFGEPWISKLSPRETINVNNYLKEIKIPMLIYNGEKDLSDFLRAAKHMEKEVEGSEFVLIPDSGGFPCWENPDEVNKVVSLFFDKIISDF